MKKKKDCEEIISFCEFIDIITEGKGDQIKKDLLELEKIKGIKGGRSRSKRLVEN